MDNKTKDWPLGFDDRWFRVIGIIVISLLIPTTFLGEQPGISGTYGIKLAISLFYTLLYWHICRLFLIYSNRRFPSLKQTRQRLAWIIVPSVAIILSLCNIMNLVIDRVLEPDSVLRVSTFQTNLASLFSFAVIAGIYEAIRYFQLWQGTELKNEQLQKENLQSQLEGLKNQVNPHFLFNSLNTLVNIIPDQPETAVRFVHQLSKVYRYILEMRESGTTTVATEVEVLKAYEFLIKERFGDNIIVNMAPSIYEAATRKIVPLSLQLLLENALKHNIASAQRPLYIDLYVENDYLVVKNNLQRKNQVQEGTGAGLQNIRNRYQLLGEKEVRIIVTQQHFSVLLPLL